VFGCLTECILRFRFPPSPHFSPLKLLLFVEIPTPTPPKHVFVYRFLLSPIPNNSQPPRVFFLRLLSFALYPHAFSPQPLPFVRLIVFAPHLSRFPWGRIPPTHPPIWFPLLRKPCSFLIFSEFLPPVCGNSPFPPWTWTKFSPGDTPWSTPHDFYFPSEKFLPPHSFHFPPPRLEHHSCQ